MRRRRYLLAITLILAAAAILRLWQVGSPAEHMFDEVYYAKDAKAIVDGRVLPKDPLRWEAGDEVSWPHPEMGKFAIAAGIILFGDRSFGWRFPSVIAGMVLLTFVYPTARRLGLSPPWALIALLFAVADPLGLAQSRIATLDIFIAVWTVICVYLALRYVQTGWRPRWLLLCGVAGGFALGTKWSGAMALLAAAMVIIIGKTEEWRACRAAHRAAADDPPDKAADAPPADLVGRHDSAALTGLGIVSLVLIPAAVYMLSYVQYFAVGHTLADWWELHRQMLHFNLTLKATHSYASIAPSWIIDYRPVWYYFEGTETYRGVVAIGNPFLWWLATLALLAAPILALLRRTTTLLPTAALVAVLYLPWFATTRTSFLYYMTPVAPYLAILAAAALAWFAGRDSLPRRGWLYLAGAALATALLWRPLGLLGAWLFWDVPRGIDGALGWVGVGVAAFVGLLLVIFLTSPRMRRRRSHTALVVAGMIVGIVAAFIPIVLALKITPEYFSQVTWFASWI